MPSGEVRPRFHQGGEALGEDLKPPADGSFFTLQLGPKLSSAGEALLKLAGGY